MESRSGEPHGPEAAPPGPVSRAPSAWKHVAMPSTIRELFAAYRLEPAGCVCWGQLLREPQTGVYVVSLTADADSLAAARQDCPLDSMALDELVSVCPRLLLDGEPTTAVAVSARIASFWIADEVAVYIGRAGQPVGKRVGQYYRTPIGAAKPHKGGWWIKDPRGPPEPLRALEPHPARRRG